MKFAHLAVLAGAYGLLMACTDGPKDDTSTDTADTAVDTDPPTPEPPIIMAIQPSGCNSGGTQFEFAIEVQNWAGEAVLNIFDTSFDPAFDEEHPMDHGFFDPDDPTFDNWEISLPEGTALENYEPGENTIFQCVNETFLTYTIEVFTEPGDATAADCAIFGHNPSEVLDGTWPDNDAVNWNGRTDVAAGRFANCVTF